MNKIIKIILISILSSLLLAGCGNKDAEVGNFTLQEIGMLSLENTKTPTLYTVNTDPAENHVTVYRNEVTDNGFSTTQEQFDIENVVVTEEEIIIEYDSKVETFIRLSESVVENNDKVQYQYTNLSESIQ